MASEFTRVHQRALGVTRPRQSHPNNASTPPEQMYFGKQVKAMIVEQLYATGHVRGGPLFGYTQYGVVTVVAAPLGGYRILDPALATDPLAFDAHYMLGWIDSLNYTSETEIDWVGTWVMWPNSVLGPTDDERAWMRRGRETDLFSASHCLCSFGWDYDMLSARAYAAGFFQEDATKLRTNF